MEVQHVCVKWFVSNPVRIDLTDYLQIFNEWIQNQVCEETLIDVADYRHVPNGPGVLLLGHEANYSMDQTGGRLGLLYNRKATDGTVAQAIRSVIKAGLRLMEHPKQKGLLSFDEHELLLIGNDRLVTPNTDDSYASVAEHLGTVLVPFFDDAHLERVSVDPRERLAIRVTSVNGLNMSTVSV